MIKTMTKNQPLRLHSYNGAHRSEEYCRVTAYYGIAPSGNGFSHFTLTGSAWLSGNTSEDDPDISGQIHDILIEAFPSLKLISMLHLADAETGVPLHAEANARFWMENPQHAPTSMDGLNPQQRVAEYLQIPYEWTEQISDGSDIAELVETLSPHWFSLARTATYLYRL